MDPLSVPTLEHRIGYSFREPRWLIEALSHPSLAQRANNQRLEFLGDSVLGAAVAKLLFEMYPKETEGELARRQAGLVCSETLAVVAREIGLPDEIEMAASEIAAGGRANPTNLEDACEALIGALFMDGGYEAAEQFITLRWKKLAASVKTPPKDAKTSLQEWAQARGLPIPVYHVLSAEGPSHAPVFTIEARLETGESAIATAGTKKVAEQAAAKLLLEELAKL